VLISTQVTCLIKPRIRSLVLQVTY
jgi:hypothetical protein